MKDPSQHPRDEKFVQHPLHSLQVLHVQNAKGQGLLDHVNKVKALMDQFVYLELPIWKEEIIMTYSRV